MSYWKVTSALTVPPSGRTGTRPFCGSAGVRKQIRGAVICICSGGGGVELLSSGLFAPVDCAGSFTPPFMPTPEMPT